MPSEMGGVASSDPFERLSLALAGRYRFQREVGSGGMARVYLAEDLRHHRRVAFKVLRPEVGHAVGSDRFLREIEIAAKLSHPHILPLFDSGEAGGILYYVMPYVEGESLRQRLIREKQLEIDEALRIARQVAAALDYAHRQNVVHRDVKPDNILLQEREALVADFGIALAVTAAGAERLTKTGLTVGTPEYMSPEQAMGERGVDARSDIYALACVLYEMLAGEPPYTGRTAQVILAKRLADPVPAVRRVRNAVPAGVEQALLKALAKVPADRFASAGAFAEALEARVGARPAGRSVAVLPFLNLSADPENEYFADGITEDVIAQLSKIRDLKVISRTSVMPFKKREQGLREIGQRLGAETLLEGSVRRAGGRVRIVAQLIDAETDRHLWAETYDRQLSDVFAIQSDIALCIAGAVRAELSPDERARIAKEPTGNLEAYRLCLKGHQEWNKWTHDGILRAIDYLQQALAEDPLYARAAADLATCYGALGFMGYVSPKEAYPRAKVAARKALEMDGSLGEAYIALGMVSFYYDWDWAAAEAAFRRALELSPNSPIPIQFYSGYLVALGGRFEEALRGLRRAQELDPLAASVESEVGEMLYWARRYDQAIEQLVKARELDPNYPLVPIWLGLAYQQKSMYEQAIDELEKGVALFGRDPFSIACLGQAYGAAGKRSEAHRLLDELQERARQAYVSPYDMALIHVGLGESERALDRLEEAYDERAGWMVYLQREPMLDPLRTDPRFQRLLQRMGLVQ